MTPSSSGLGHRPFTAVTRVRLSLGSPKKRLLKKAFFIFGRVCVFIIYSFMFAAWRSKKTEALGIFLFSADVCFLAGIYSVFHLFSAESAVPLLWDSAVGRK